MQINTDLQEAIVQSTALGLRQTECGRDQPVLLRLSMLPHEIIMKSCIWHAQPELYYTLPGALGLLRTQSEKTLFSGTLAPHMLSQKGCLVGVHVDNREDVSALLERLCASFVLRAEGPHMVLH